MIAGGFNDFSEEGSYEFANTGATSNSVTEFPMEMSRPTSSSRDSVSLSLKHIKSPNLTAFCNSWGRRVAAFELY